MYGETASSRQDDPTDRARIFGWHLDRILDTNGNSIVFSYTKDNGQIYPQAITYTGWKNTKGDKKVLFNFADRADILTSYRLGFPVITRNRLRTVEVWGANKRLCVYEIAYNDTEKGNGAASATGLCCLTGITRWDGQQKEHLAPTSFSYNDTPLTPTLASWPNGPAPNGDFYDQVVAGDFNGDGRTDLAWYSGSPAGTWKIYVSTGNGWKEEDRQGPTPQLPIYKQVVIGDFNGDGKTDIAWYTGKGDEWQVALSNKTGWDPVTTWHGPSPTDPEVPNQVIAGDFNGDGKTDLAWYSGSPAGTWKVYISTGNGWKEEDRIGPALVNSIFLKSGQTYVAQPGLNIRQQIIVGDFNGDVIPI